MGIAIGSACLALFGAFIIWFIWRRRNQSRKVPTILDNPPENKYSANPYIAPDTGTGHGMTQVGYSELEGIQTREPRELDGRIVQGRVS